MRSKFRNQIVLFMQTGKADRDVMQFQHVQWYNFGEKGNLGLNLNKFVIRCILLKLYTIQRLKHSNHSEFQKLSNKQTSNKAIANTTYHLYISVFSLGLQYAPIVFKIQCSKFNIAAVYSNWQSKPLKILWFCEYIAHFHNKQASKWY